LITIVVEHTLVDPSTLILDEVYISSESTSDVVDVLMESSMHIQVAKYSLATPMITGLSMRQLLLASLLLVSHQSPSCILSDSHILLT